MQVVSIGLLIMSQVFEIEYSSVDQLQTNSAFGMFRLGCPCAPTAVTYSTMATALLRRQLRLAHPQRCFSIHHPRAQVITENPSRNSSGTPAGSAFDRPHTVEDLHGMSAVDILSETGTRKDTAMRHFTGVCQTLNAAVYVLTGI